MIFIRRLSISACLAMGLAACSGGGGGGGSANYGPLDFAGVSGSGTYEDPYVVPAENQPGRTQPLEHYLSQPGYWRIEFDGIQVDLGTTQVTFENLIYDSVRNEWSVDIDGTVYQLQFNRAEETYEAAPGCNDVSCTGFFWSDVPGLGQYGMLAVLGQENGADIESIAWMYGGLKTPPDSLPKGAAYYHGAFVGGIVVGDVDYLIATDRFVVNAFFHTGHINVQAADNLLDSDGNPTGQSFSFDADGTLSGSMFVSSSAEAIRYDGLMHQQRVIAETYVGVLEGAFFGPAADEVAGVTQADSTTVGGNQFFGGFWGLKLP